MPVHYQQTRDESAALLKRVIGEMGQHDAPYSPTTFAVWYEHLAGINPGLSRAMKACLESNSRIQASHIERLFHDHLADPNAEVAQAAAAKVTRVMSNMAEKAEATGRDAEVYGQQLQGLSQALSNHDQTDRAANLTPHLNEVASGTHRMQEAATALAKAVADGQAEIERLREALVRSRTEAITDPLTQLLNRKGFDEALRGMLAQPAATGKAHCLVTLDIDHFKRVNDTYGHPMGDTVIQTLGVLLKRVANDPGMSAARIGGEEFALLLPQGTAAQAAQLAQTVRSLLSATKIRKRGAQEVIITVTVSAGVAAFGPGDDATSLMAAADAALYRSKEGGRDRVTVA
jgi:diguanylate cyclase